LSDNDESCEGSECEKVKCESLQDPRKIRRQQTDQESARTKELLAKILDKVEKSDMMLHEMKSDLSSFTNTIISHSSSIKLLEEQMGHIANILYCNSKKVLVFHGAVYSKSDPQLLLALVT